MKPLQSLGLVFWQLPGLLDPASAPVPIVPPWLGAGLMWSQVRRGIYSLLGRGRGGSLGDTAGNFR